MTQKEQIDSLRNRHIGKLLTIINEVHPLPELVETAIKREFSFFAEDIKNQVLGTYKENENEVVKHRT